MRNNKIVLLLVIISFILVGCGAKTPSMAPANTQGTTPVAQVPGETAYPQPVPQTPVATMNLSYPGPQDGQVVPTIVTTPQDYVSDLAIPTPSSGKAIVTGQLLVGGKGGEPYLTTLYLGPTLPPSTPDYPPMISFSEATDKRAVQEVDTGRFLFTDVEPGQYAIIIWTPYGGNPLVDVQDATILFTVNAGEVKDLGILPIK